MDSNSFSQKFYDTWPKLKASPALREALVFFGISAVFGLVWLVGYEWLLHPKHTFDLVIDRLVALQASYLFRVFGFESSVIPVWPYVNLIYINNQPGVNVDTPCNGFPMLYLFLAFIVAHPGPLKNKLWFAPFGLLLIHAVNILRIMALGLIAVYYRQFFDINHKYVYTIIIYSLIISLFAWWHLRLASPAPKQNTPS